MALHDLSRVRFLNQHLGWPWNNIPSKQLNLGEKIQINKSQLVIALILRLCGRLRLFNANAALKKR